MAEQSPLKSIEERERFGARLAQRQKELRKPWTKIQVDAGIKSGQTLTEIRDQKRKYPTLAREETLENLCLAVGWTRGSWQLIVNGEDPVEAGPDDVPPGQMEAHSVDAIDEIRADVASMKDDMAALVESLDVLLGVNARARVADIRDRLAREANGG